MQLLATFFSYLFISIIHVSTVQQTDTINTVPVDTVLTLPSDTIQSPPSTEAVADSLKLNSIPIVEENVDEDSVVKTPSKTIKTENQEYENELDPKKEKEQPAIKKGKTIINEKNPIYLSKNISDSIKLTPEQASAIIQKAINNQLLWKDDSDTLRHTLNRLLLHYNLPYDSVVKIIPNYRWDSITFFESRHIERDTLPLRWLDKTTFIVDTIPLEKDPVYYKQTITLKALDPLSMATLGLKKTLKQEVEDVLAESVDTIMETIIDRDYLQSKNIELYQMTNKGISPVLRYNKGFRMYRFNADSSQLVMMRTEPVIEGNETAPFRYVKNIGEIDSLRIASQTLLAHTTKRDSIPIYLSDIQGGKTSFWLSTGKEGMFRYWIKNSNNDSITIWIGNPSSNDILLALEDNVMVERLEQKSVEHIPFTKIMPSRELAKLNPLKEIPIHWKYGIVGSYALNENFFSNYWAQGGESSLNSLLDINALSEYNNSDLKLKWTTTGRMRYGVSWTQENAIRTSTDILEINSQSNKVWKDKIDFSAILYLKSQVAKGYNYPNDSVPISKFLNPGALTVGLGLEFKPYNKTTINFSPLSYRNTFVLDTLTIDQTLHGVETGKRSKQELGGQLVVKNSLNILKDMEINNTVRLFSSYLDKPQNMDVDWEMSLEKQISIYFKIKFNLHLIYNDKILFPLVDKQGDPILLPNGAQKKGAKVQFNQMLGLTLEWRL